MSKKKKKKQQRFTGVFTAVAITVTIAICVTASLLHMDALERLTEAEARLTEIETMQGHIRVFLANRGQMQ